MTTVYNVRGGIDTIRAVDSRMQLAEGGRQWARPLFTVYCFLERCRIRPSCATEAMSVPS